MQCAEQLRLQAAFDGELDAVAAAAVERHAASCPECRALREHLERTRAQLRRDLDYGQAAPELRARIMETIAAEAGREARAAARPRSRRGPLAFWLGAATGVAGAALAAAVTWFLVLPVRASALPDELIGAHLASLAPARLTAVISTDRHTVKPWFAGHADVSPVVADFAPQGYTLIGGRADEIGQQRAAVVVYRHGAHVINVFALIPRGQSLPAATTRRGYHIACWRAADLAYCMVSDAGWDEMQGLERLLEALAVRDARPTGE